MAQSLRLQAPNAVAPGSIPVQGTRSQVLQLRVCMLQLKKKILSTAVKASLTAQLVKNPPAMGETWVRSLGWADPLEKGKATHSSALAWRTPWTVHGVSKSWTQLSNFHFQAHYIYCVLYFYFYCVSSTSDCQALDPRGWGPLS